MIPYRSAVEQKAGRVCGLSFFMMVSPLLWVYGTYLNQKGGSCLFNNYLIHYYNH